jgi:hypothetical protein
VRVNRISGHRDVDSTECPGTALYHQLATIRRKTGSGSARRTSITAAAEPSQIDYGQRVRLSGRLQSQGTGLGGTTIEVQRYDGSAWRVIAHARTDAAGDYERFLGRSRNSSLRAAFRGDDLYAATVSRAVSVDVRPVLSLSASPDSVAVGEAVTLSGTIGPPKPSVTIVVERRVGMDYSTVRSDETSASDGSFERTYHLATAGMYRFRARFEGDSRNLPASSNDVSMTVVA